MTEQNGINHFEEGDQEENSNKKPSTKPKITREIDTQTPDSMMQYPAGRNSASVTTFGCQTENPPNGAAAAAQDNTNMHAQESDGRRPSLSRRRNFSHSLSPRFNQHQEFSLPAAPIAGRLAASADHDGGHVDNSVKGQGNDDGGRPSADQIFRRKSSLPSRPTDLRLLFTGNRNSRDRNRIAERRRIDGRFVGDGNEVSFELATAEIVESFMVSSYERDLRQSVFEDEIDADLPSPGSVRETPDIPEFQQSSNPFSPTTLVGRRLALIADELETRHGGELDRMVMQILPQFILCSGGSENALTEAFALFKNVASRIFDHGQITWSRIVTLLSFGYRMGISLYRQGISGFVSLVVGFVTKYIVLEPIQRWIVQSGGWLAALTFRLTNDADVRAQLAISAIWGITALTVTAVILHRFFSGK